MMMGRTLFLAIGFLSGTLLSAQAAWGKALHGDALHKDARQGAALSIAVASNFRPVAQRLADDFTRRTGHRVTLSSASSGVLYNQVFYGASYDLFFSADRERPRMLQEAGKVKGEPKTYAYGRLVFWQPGNPTPDYKVLSQWQGNLAMADPGKAPYGFAAQQVLEYFDLWGKPRIELVQGMSVQQAWQFIATGNVRAGFVALSQVVGGKIDSGYLLLRDELYNPIRQNVVIIKTSKNTKLAQQFLDFIFAEPQQKIIQEAGYYPGVINTGSRIAGKRAELSKDNK